MDQPRFTKTAKGSKEIEERSGLLSSVARRILIMVDGKRTRSDLLQAFSLAELEEGLSRLELLKMIEESSGPANSHEGVSINQRALAQIRQMMYMSNQQYLAGQLDRFLDKDFALIHDRAGLEPVLEHWHRLLCDAGHEVTAYAYLRQIKTTLGWSKK
ncbi:hypothetical protein WAE56_03185 [Iodobacter sp. LRB]|uniref:hypothetical protein n=1 Tax=unclassified Iodobacter TaxID=235634 RepID=UPI000C0F6F75|nr:hypothetical protein [Iodobacter sp. BJB302]PHV03241.1 hypothetical protein CSQ88_02890 [Iodobacter sp. BJB302]